MHFCILCDLIARYCLCVPSRGPSKHHLVSVSWDEDWLERLFFDQLGDSDNCQLGIALLTFKCEL